MRRFALVFLIAILLLVSGRAIQVSLDSHYDGERGPYLQLLTPDSVVVRWQTAEPVVSQLQLDNQPVESGPAATTKHRVTLNNLQPQTRYHYQVTGLNAVAETDFSFITPPAHNDKSTPVRLWVLGDPGSATPTHKAAREAGQQWLQENQRDNLPLLDLWLTTGDNAYTSGREQEYQQAIFEPYQDWLGSFALIPAMGNHDIRRRVFYNIFEFPQNGQQGGIASNSQRYFSIDHGPLHLVMLDSEWALVHDRDAMLNWLQQDLQNNTRPWTIAIWHHPPYSKGSHDSDDTTGNDIRIGLVRKYLLPIIDQYNVDLVINGHSHVYERSHLLAGHYGKSGTLTNDMIIQAGTGSDDHFIKDTDCTADCGTVYQILGSTAELRPGKHGHPALPVGLNKAGTLLLEMNADCLHSRFLDGEGISWDIYYISSDNDVKEHDCRNEMSLPFITGVRNDKPLFKETK